MKSTAGYQQTCTTEAVLLISKKIFRPRSGLAAASVAAECADDMPLPRNYVPNTGAADVPGIGIHPNNLPGILKRKLRHFFVLLPVLSIRLNKTAFFTSKDLLDGFCFCFFP
jgi:hypothetical protein